VRADLINARYRNLPAIASRGGHTGSMPQAVCFGFVNRRRIESLTSRRTDAVHLFADRSAN
jgi:hypothetical protein